MFQLNDKMSHGYHPCSDKMIFFPSILSLPESLLLPEIAETETGRWRPRVDISETDNAIQIEAELPGMDKSNIKLKVKGNTLVLQGERKMEQKEEDRQYRRVERFYGSFTRTFPLPQGSDVSKIQANFENGILNITVPKPTIQEDKGSEIEIKSTQQH